MGLVMWGCWGSPDFSMCWWHSIPVAIPPGAGSGGRVLPSAGDEGEQPRAPDINIQITYWQKWV